VLEGVLEAGDLMTVIEDVLTTGGAALDAVQKVREAGGRVLAVVGVLDREEGAEATFEQVGVPLRTLFRRSDLPTG
jgi:orotate phosphoribosyltransferase